MEEINSLQHKLRRLEMAHKSHPTPESFTTLSQTRMALNRLFLDDVGRSLLWSRQRYYSRSNKMDTPLARLLKPRPKFQAITSIRDDTGLLVTTPTAIRDTFTRYFRSLYDHTPTHTPANETLCREIKQYLADASLPSLPDSRLEPLSSPVTEEELHAAFKSMKPHKAPGPDGFTYHYYKSHSGILGPHLLSMFNNLLEGGKLPADSLLASIALIPKPGKDKHMVGNYRPISLINTDLKLFTKILSKRLDLIMGTLIHPDQVGFIPGRQAYENTRRSADLLWLASSGNTPSLFLSLDAEKAFDRAEWPFLFTLLSHLGFPPPFVRAIQALYSIPTAQIIISGTDPLPFPIRNGTRQGCPLSPALFALFLEPLLQHLRKDPHITGFRMGDQEYKLSAYADDILLSLTRPLSSLPAVMRRLDEFSRLSGYKVNITKSEAVATHMSQGDLDTIRGAYPIRVSPTSIDYLGIALPSNPGDLYDKNFPPLLSQLKKDLESWSKYAISWVGRVHCIKMNVLPRLLFFFQALPCALPSEDIRLLQSTIDHFIWQGKRHRIARATLYRPKDAGGLGLPCLFSYYYAAQLAQIVAWHSPRGLHRWVDLERTLMHPDHPHLWIWLPKPQRPLLRTTCPAILNSIHLWDKLATKCDLTSLPSPLSPVLRNKDFLPGYNARAEDGWMGTTIRRLYQLFPGGIFIDQIDPIISGSSANTNPLPYFQLRAFANQRHIKEAALTPLTPFERLCQTGSYPRGLISTLYRSLTTILDWKTLRYVAAWEADLGESLEAEEWADIWESMRSVSVCTTHQEQLIKTIFRWYVTPVQMSRISPGTPDSCWRGCGARGTYIHMWWECPTLKTFWSQTHTLAMAVLSKDIPMDPWAFLLSRPVQDLTRQENKLLAKITLAARRVLAESWNSPRAPSFTRLSSKMQDVCLMDELTAISSHTLPAYYNTWAPWIAQMGEGRIQMDMLQNDIPL
uniref:Reverse transcriptase domain-containing protein n=1 Tax=Leptobrachium leishanense TaxID=445787 RepID=A0A8C5M4V5_9ANUR